MRYTFKNRLSGRKHVLEIQMQYNIYMQGNNVTFCMSNTLSQDINTCLAIHISFLRILYIYILHTCDIFAAYKKTKYSLCISQMYISLDYSVASHILLVYIFTHIHTFVCIYIYVYSHIHYIQKFSTFSEILGIFNAYYVYINILTHNWKHVLKLCVRLHYVYENMQRCYFLNFCKNLYSAILFSIWPNV